MEQAFDVRLAMVTKPEPLLFGDVLLESQNGFRKSRGPATVTSFFILATMLTLVALMPLLFPEALPKQQLLVTLIAPPPPPPPPPPAPAVAPQAVKAIAHSEVITNSQLQAPSAIPKQVALIKEDPQPQSAGIGGVAGGIPGGQLGGVIGGIISSVPTAGTVPKLASAVPNKPVRVSSGICEGLLIYHPAPEYPRLARAAHVQGQVMLKATISKDGHIENLQALNGHPLLVTPAIQAVRGWRYRPYMLNGEAVEVETEITVNFMLNAQV